MSLLSLLHSPYPHCETEMHLPWGMNGQQLRSQSSELEFMSGLTSWSSDSISEFILREEAGWQEAEWSTLALPVQATQ